MKVLIGGGGYLLTLNLNKDPDYKTTSGLAKPSVIFTLDTKLSTSAANGSKLKKYKIHTLRGTES